MKTKILIIISFMCASLLTMSCQKDNGLQPENSVEATLAADDLKNAKPRDFTDQVMLDPIKNYPNPFVNKTTIEYRIDKISRVGILIVNENEERVDYIASGYRKPGTYTAEFDATGLPSGTYFAILTMDYLEVRERMLKLDSPKTRPFPGME